MILYSITCSSSSGLQALLNICYNCGVELDVLFNERKSKVMIFKSTTHRHFQECRVECSENKLITVLMRITFLLRQPKHYCGTNC